MKGNGILDKVRNAFLTGESRDNLNKIYNKGTVTKVYNKLIKNNELDINTNSDDSKVKEEKISSLIQEILLLADKNKEYTFTIKIKENKLENKKSVDLINPFKLAGEVNTDKMKEILNGKDVEYIKNVIKKHLKYNNKKLNSLDTKEELIDYIIKSIKKTTSIGESFR
ncbi:hypothetical protein [Clostridium sp.]|uniref:hypothetical protein n=1 Tax=Clostridium sp. TaxID=1506 RepID=UPI00261BD867|nr:hypothetical protein [Clostridium sp.]